MSDVVLFETKSLKDGRQLGVVTLNAPKTLNSLSLDMIDLMLPQLIKWQDDPQIVLVLFLSAGDRAFSAGGDIQNLYHDMVEHPEGPCPYSDAFFEREYRLDYLIQTYDKPTVVWGQGIAMGGGLGVLTACSHKIGTETMRIAMPEITIGLFPDAGATYALSRMPEHYAYFLAWTGANVNGEDARRVGLIDYLGESGVDFWLCTTCSEASPTSDSKVCEVHDGVILERGGFEWDAKCVCECAGVSKWDNKVRGCLHCAEMKGVDRDEAHNECYTVADTIYGDVAGWIARLEIFFGCQKCRI